MLIHQALYDIGLTEKEVELYLSGLKLGSQPASIIAKDSGVNRTTAYVILNGLVDKGLMTRYLRADVWYYTATQPENLSIYVDRKRKELEIAKEHLENIVPELKGKMQFAHDTATVKFYEGIDGLKAMYDVTLKEKAPISEYLFDYNCDLQKMLDFWGVYIARRSELKIPLRLIVADNPIGMDLKLRDEGEGRETRLVPKDRFPYGNSLIMIFSDHYAYCSYAEGKFYGALIKDKYLASMELAIFDFIWEYAGEYDKKLIESGKLDDFKDNPPILYPNMYPML